MTASTVVQKYATAAKSKKVIFDKIRQFKLPNAAPAGRMVPFEFTSDTIATTSLDEADDRVDFFVFPAQCRLWSLRVYNPLAKETGTPASVTDFRSGTTVLINDSEVLRTDTTSDELDAGLSGIDVSNGVFNMLVVTPGDTEVAGTIQVFGTISVGTVASFGA